MSLVVTVVVNGVPVGVELGDEQLCAIAAALPAPGAQGFWPEWMDASKAANYLGVSLERVRKLKERGAIPAYQEAPRCRVLFHRPELDQWMASFRVAPRRGDA